MVDGDHGGGRGMNISSRLGNIVSVTPTWADMSNKPGRRIKRLSEEGVRAMPATSPARRASFSEGEGEDGEGERLERPGAGGLLAPSFLPAWETELCQWGNGSFVVARPLARQLARLDAHGAEAAGKEGGDLSLGWALDWRSLARGNVAACFGRQRLRRTQRRTDARTTAHTSNADLNERKIFPDQAGGRATTETGQDGAVTCDGDDQEG